MSDDNRSTGVSLIAIFFFITAVPSLVGTVLFIIDGLVPALSDGLGEGLLVNTYALALGVVATLFYGVIAVAAGYGIWTLKSWGRSLGILILIFLLFIIPVGTVIGALIIWYLRKQEVRDSFVETFMF